MSRDVLEELVTKFVYDVDQVGLRKYESAQKRINNNAKQMIGLNSTLAKGLRRLFIGAGAVMGIQSLVGTYRNIDLIRRSIEGLTKSTQDWDYIQKEALRTGTGIEVVAKGYRNFYSAASMAGFDKSGIQSMYSDVLIASRSIGASQQQVEGALLALEQMLSKGKVSMEELRRQLGNALPGAFEIGAKAMGVTTQKFNEMVKAGISAQEFVPKFTKELLKTYEGAFPEAIKSLDYAMVNLRTSWKLFQYEIMSGSAGQGLAQTINSLTEFLRSPQAIAIAKGLGQALNLVSRALGIIVKNFKLILFLFGINMLNQVPMLFGKLTRMVLMFNKEILVTGSMVGGLNKLLPSTVILLKAIGKSGLLIMKNFWWVFILGAVITTIGLALQDIFMYLKDPEAFTLTRQLAEKIPEFEASLKRFKKGLEDVREIWVNSIQPSVKNFLDSLMVWVGGEHPILGSFFEWLLRELGKVLGALGDVLTAMQKIDDANPFSEKNKRIRESRGRVGKSIINHLPYMQVLNAGRNLADAPFKPNYTLQKTETYSPTITNNVTIQATDRTTGDITNIVRNVMSGEIDNVSSMVSYTPYMQGLKK